jgi:hypothetical protein
MPFRCRSVIRQPVPSIDGQAKPDYDRAAPQRDGVLPLMLTVSPVQAGPERRGRAPAGEVGSRQSSK